MAGNIKGITIQFNGDTTKLDKALRQVRNSTKDIDKELKQVDKALKFNPTSVELWRQKQELLRQKITQTKDNLKQLKDAQAQMDAKGVDKNSQEYRELQREIVTTESKLKNFNKQLREVGNANLKALSAQFKEVGGKMASVGQTMTTKVTAPIVAGYALASNYASDYEENLNKLDVAFGSNSQSVKDWANNAREAYGLSKVQATQAASAFGALGKGIGLSEKDAADMSTTLAGLSADLGSYFNVGTDESSKALEGIFTGESEALKKFGVVMTDTNLQKFAEDQGLVWKELDQTEKTMLRYQYVLDKTKDAQGDFARTSDGTANSTKIFQASLQDLGTAIGTNLLPIITPVIQSVTKLINKFNELSPETQKIITIIGLVVAAMGPLLLIVGKFTMAIGSIMSLAGTLGVSIGAIAGPIGIAVAVIAGLVAAGILLYKNWDKIKAFAKKLKKDLVKTFEEIKKTVTKAWESVKTATITVWNAIKTAVNNAINAVRLNVTVVLNAIRTTFTTVWDSIKFVTVTVWNAIKTAIITPITAAKNTLVTIVNTIKTTLTTAFSSISSTVRTAFDAVKNAITQPINTAKDLVNSAVQKIKSIFPIRLGKIFSGIKLPHFKISGGKVPWGIGGEGVAPSVKIEWYKTGGIFNSPTIAGIGEAGPEAVVPLDTLWRKLDNIADASSGGGIVINVYASPGMNINELAAAVEQKLVAQQKQRRAAWGY